MGGRGSWSAGALGEIDVHDAGMQAALIGGEIGSEETRGDIAAMAGNAGFRDIDGTGDIPTGILGAQMLQLQNLEHRFGAVGGGHVEVLATPGGNSGTIALVAYNDATGRQTLVFNQDYFQNVGSMNRRSSFEQNKGFHMPTSNTVLTNARYDVTHEYGHLLHNTLYNEAKANGYKGTRKQFVSREWLKIQKIANEKYHAKKSDLSAYGKENRREAFAEAFANSQLGKPTKVGLAMRDYLKHHGF